MITGPQLRAARGLLDWTRTQLSVAAKISPETVKNIEHGTFKPQEETAQKIYAAFAQYDVVFTENEGVQIRKDSVERYEGREGFKRFIDDVYNVAKTDPDSHVGGSKPICLSCSDDGLFTKHLGDYFDHHARRMNELGDIKMKILTKQKPTFALQEETPENSYREYRWFTQQAVGSVPFYVYGDKLAILAFGDDVNIVVISSSLVARAYREQFEVLWQSAKPLDKASDPRVQGQKKQSK